MMRDSLLRPTLAAMIAGASLAVAACGDGADEANNAANAADANMTFEGANDQSALESAANATSDTLDTPAPANTGTTDTDSVDPAGETDGGDTGGNTLDSNVSGM